MRNKKLKVFSILLFFFISFQLSFFFIAYNVRGIDVPGFKYQARINANQTIAYHFNNNIEFEISTNVILNNLSIEYENQIQNRQISLTIMNNKSISLNVTSKKEINNFAPSKIPKEPMIGGFQLRNNYGCIYSLKANQTIQNITIRYRKIIQFGLNLQLNYSFALFKSTQDSWEIVKTIEKVNQSSSERYLEITLLNLEGNEEYFFTLYEVNEYPYDWTGLIITIIILVLVGVISLVIVISKQDFINYIKTRNILIDKGAHRLSLDDVLENENRNKIIDIILDEPGIHFNELLRKTDLAAGNLVWHLEILSKYKIIGKKDIGRYVAYFPYYPKNPISNLDLKLQKSKLTLQILEMIEEKPGIWNSIIKKKMNVDHKTIYYHTSKLIELNLIIVKKDGRKKKFYPNLESEYYSNKILQ
ncbi:MAG: winged helix-turn-helix transcriptional regulator [Promethearchaeota archaeon]